MECHSMKLWYVKKFKYMAFLVFLCSVAVCEFSYAKKDKGRGKKKGHDKCKGWRCDQPEISGINDFSVKISAKDILNQERKLETSNFCVYPGASGEKVKLKWDAGTGKGYLENPRGDKIYYRLGVAVGANQGRPDYKFTRGTFSPAKRIVSLRPCSSGNENMTLFFEIQGSELAGKTDGRYGNDQIKIILETE